MRQKSFLNYFSNYLAAVLMLLPAAAADKVQPKILKLFNSA
jgi:hypothetical protein